VLRAILFKASRKKSNAFFSVSGCRGVFLQPRYAKYINDLQMTRNEK